MSFFCNLIYNDIFIIINMINMKNKYVVYFKGTMVFLLILLIVVGFSFGVTFSSFVYSSNNHRAVEMYANKLNYRIYLNNEETNSIILKPGNNLISVKIESLNKVDTYYKLVLNSEYDAFYYNSKVEETLKKNDSIEYKVDIYNNSNENSNVVFKVEGGYITNTIDDIKISNGYYEINDEINTGQSIVLNHQNYKLLGINEDGSIELIGDIIENKLSFSGSNGFNNSIKDINNLINNVIDNENVVEVRSINLFDVLKYTSNEVVKYTTLSAKRKDNNDIYVPSSLLNVESEEDYSILALFSSPRIDINNELFKSSNNYNLFSSETPYFLATTYNESNSDNIEYGIFEISDELHKLKLYDWNNNSFDASSNVRPFVKLSYKINIKDID